MLPIYTHLSWLNSGKQYQIQFPLKLQHLLSQKRWTCAEKSLMMSGFRRRWKNLSASFRSSTASGLCLPSTVNRVRTSPTFLAKRSSCVYGMECVTLPRYLFWILLCLLSAETMYHSYSTFVLNMEGRIENIMHIISLTFFFALLTSQSHWEWCRFITREIQHHRSNMRLLLPILRWSRLESRTFPIVRR